MRKFKVNKETREDLLNLYAERKIYLEGNILKLIDSDGDKDFDKYLEDAIQKDKESRKKRLDITKDIQTKNKALTELNQENERVNKQLKKALSEAEESKNEAIKSKEEEENSRVSAEKARTEAEIAKEEADNARIEAEKAKEEAENSLDLIQRKKQFELIGTIVRISLFIILGVGITTTLIYVISMFTQKDTTNIFTAWSNIIGILLTNAFSIIGTIMGVKYASSEREKKD